MKASEVIAELIKLISTNGDIEMYVQINRRYEPATSVSWLIDSSCADDDRARLCALICTSGPVSQVNPVNPVNNV